MEKGKPDLAIIDVRMPPGFRDEGLRAALEIRRRWPDAALVVVSRYVEECYASELPATENRSIGYLLKDRIADVRDFIEALPGSRTAVRCSTRKWPPAAGPQPKTDPLSRVTAREREVLALMAGGQSNTAMASSLVVSTEAAEKHVANVFAKLDLPPDDGQHSRRVRAVVRYLNS